MSNKAANFIEKTNQKHLSEHEATNEVIQEIYRSGLVRDAQGSTYPHDSSSVTFQAGALLYAFVREMKPAKTIEIGMAYGLSSLFICQALSDNGSGQHTAIDPFQEKVYKSIGLLNLERANLKEIFRFYESPSEVALPQLVSKNETFDFAFIDGSHLFDNAFVDFFFIDRMIEEGGYIAVDDIWMPAVRKVVSFILKSKPYDLMRPPYSPDTSFMLRGARLGRRILQNPLGRDWTLKLIPENIALLKKTGQDQRSWDFHREF
ncbi:MAG: class I SAM-dependent methyltransferase [Leptolyngbya sp. SIOISBB]|nr:class I SAM-dependent methyltransferase [Leptolyngbya sp. SIOISBB]